MQHSIVAPNEVVRVVQGGGPTLDVFPIVACVDAGGRLLAASANAAALADKASAQPLSPGDLHPELGKLLRRFHEGGGVTPARARLQHPRFGPLDARVSAAGVRDEDGRDIAALLVIERAADDDKMRHLDRLASIGTLSASMAHEIKNALLPVKTFVDLLASRHPDAELAGVVGREVGRINAILGQMLKFAGPARPTFARLHLHEVLKQSLGLLRLQLEGRNISLRLDLAAASDRVRGDAYQLEQVLLNLFFNALDAMGPGGELRVATEQTIADLPARPQTPALRVAVTDTGLGIAPEHLPRLFEPYFTTKPQGTGLGLSITRRIVEEHGGVIRARSEPSRGATFEILLPLDA
jgi:signal transduction histidine kinase